MTVMCIGGSTVQLAWREGGSGVQFPAKAKGASPLNHILKCIFS